MKRRALVVDDNRALAEDLGEILAGEGYDVCVFFDPLRALEASATLAFDVALLDVRMPALDGVSLHRRLVAGHPRAQFVLMTAYAEDERIAEALGAGAHTVLTKPVALRELLRALEEATAGERRQLLLVEDDLAFGEALAEALEDSGYGVRLARSLTEARGTPPAALSAAVVDVRLPDGQGTDLAVELTRRGIPVVLVTGFSADEPLRVVGELNGRGHLLTKPFAPTALLEALVALRGVAS